MKYQYNINKIKINRENQMQIKTTIENKSKYRN